MKKSKAENVWLLHKQERAKVMNLQSKTKARAGVFLCYCIMGLFIYLVHFNPDFFYYLYGEEGLLVIDGGWFVRSLLASIPLVVFGIGLGFVSGIFREHTNGIWKWETWRSSVVFFIVVAFTIRTTEFNIRIPPPDFWDGVIGDISVISQNIGRFILNLVALLPGNILLNRIYSNLIVDRFSSERYRFPMSLTDNPNLQSLINDKFTPRG